MKKLIFLPIFILSVICISSLSEAGFYPESSAGVTPPSEYGGLQFSTRQLTTSSTTITGPLVVSKVCFSTSAPTVFAELRASSVAVNILSVHITTITRVYNSYKLHNSTDAVSATVASGCQDVGPVYIHNNLVWDVSVGSLNTAILLYHKPRGN